jgi:hypothetical protein
VDHPLVITEPPLNPPSGRAALAELCFEAYGAPALHLVDGGAAAFSAYRARGRWGAAGRGRCRRTGPVSLDVAGLDRSLTVPPRSAGVSRPPARGSPLRGPR